MVEQHRQRYHTAYQSRCPRGEAEDGYDLRRTTIKVHTYTLLKFAVQVLVDREAACNHTLFALFVHHRNPRNETPF